MTTETTHRGPLTDASMNHARSLGPALISEHLDVTWIYLSAPVLGMYLAHPSCHWIQGEACCGEENSMETAE